ncbi:glycosyltransferase family 4 protein [Pedobacter fastidiosus]|uniref:Glycosyltransferase family 4 protein n=1 Tax=Pedobacter fastidiosus TaxID=2765361 RepID=A0ABR7KWB9_9SPHI|nr:glycosyltransferase family 1 protein [Pedobacter fastidiosus]MBC6112115.1 glycosyltransferase family 4 protein [Pedobacter fastidiosus]
MYSNKLRVGVILENYKKEEGGKFSYYSTLVDGIANFNFEDGLEFVFVAFDADSIIGSPTNTFCFNITEIVKKKYKILSILHTLSKFKIINLFSIVSQIQISYNKRFNQEVKSKLAENNIDLIYALTPFFKDLNYPTVTTHWDIGHKSMFSFPEVTNDGEFEFREDYYQKYLEKAFAIICESEAGKQELCKYKNINTNRVFVVPMFAGHIVGLNVSKTEQQVFLDKFGLTKNKFFMYPAQFWAHKNHYNLIRAFLLLHKKYPELKLIFSGSDKGNLDYIIEVVKYYEIENSVIFCGFISNEELFSAYKNSISLVMPTLLGPTNMPLLEARALGCKVICSDLEGHRESLGDYPMYVNPLNYDEIFKAMEHYYLSESIETLQGQDDDFNTSNTALIEINKVFKNLYVIRKTFSSNFKINRV